jgi:hypothetical protein
MKTGSMVNLLMDQSKPTTTPKVGDGCTILMWSDRHAATITKVSSNGRRIWIKEDISTRTDKNGFSENQTYTYKTDHAAPPVLYTLRKNGKYIKAGEPLRYGLTLLIGKRMTYFDYSF